MDALFYWKNMAAFIKYYENVIFTENYTHKISTTQGKVVITAKYD